MWPAGEIFLFPHVSSGDKLNTFFTQQVDTSLDHVFSQFHLGDAIHQQPAYSIGALVDGNVVPRLVQLVGGRQAGRTGTDDGYLLIGAVGRRVGFDPPFGKSAIDDRVFDVLDRHGRIGNAQDACAFARRGACAARELGKVVCLVQSI